MSGVSHHGPAVRLVQAVSLAVVLGVAFVATHTVPVFEGASGVAAAVGLLLLTGILASELLELVKLPHITGYLIAGIVVGPHVLRLVDHHAVAHLSLVNTLALALIALAGGAELRLSVLRQTFRSLCWAMLCQSVLGLVLVAGAFLALASRLPFTQGLGWSASIGAGLLWGALGLSRSPSATLGVLSETRAQGPVARFAIAFVMSSDVVVIVLLAVVMVVARPLIQADAGMSLMVFKDLGHELLGSLSLGTSLGLMLALYLRFAGEQLLLILVLLGFGVTEGVHYLRFDPLLTFLVAGFAVQNLSKQGDKLLSAIEHTGGIVFVVFFATAGAHLDLPLLKLLWPYALALSAARAFATGLAHVVGARLAGDQVSVRRWGWTPLISQAGLTFGLAVVIERAFPAFGSGFHSLVIATVALNEIVGPILFKVALDRSRESALTEPDVDDEMTEMPRA